MAQLAICLWRAVMEVYSNPLSSPTPVACLFLCRDHFVCAFPPPVLPSFFLCLLLLCFSPSSMLSSFWLLAHDISPCLLLGWRLRLFDFWRPQSLSCALSAPVSSFRPCALSLSLCWECLPTSIPLRRWHPPPQTLQLPRRSCFYGQSRPNPSLLSPISISAHSMAPVFRLCKFSALRHGPEVTGEWAGKQTRWHGSSLHRPEFEF